MNRPPKVLATMVLVLPAFGATWLFWLLERPRKR